MDLLKDVGIMNGDEIGHGEGGPEGIVLVVGALEGENEGRIEGSIEGIVLDVGALDGNDVGFSEGDFEGKVLGRNLFEYVPPLQWQQASFAVLPSSFGNESPLVKQPIESTLSYHEQLLPTLSSKSTISTQSHKAS